MLKIIMYGAEWCADCLRAKMFFQDLSINYEYHDIDAEPGALQEMQKINPGMETIPLILFGDGSFILEPSYQQLQNKFGIK